MRVTVWSWLFVGALAILGVESVEARTHRVSQIPRGDSFGCTSCHATAAGGGNFTPFGTTTISGLVGTGTTATLDLDWSKIYMIDSDRDGFTNGEELGDPNGTWKIGDPDPSGAFFHPGDDSKHPVGSCGDGRVTPPEECDGVNVNGLTCINLGLDAGPLTCDASCQYVLDACGQTDSPDVGVGEDGGVVEEPAVDDAVDAEEGCSSVAGFPTLLGVWLGALGFGRRRARARRLSS